MNWELACKLLSISKLVLSVDKRNRLHQAKLAYNALEKSGEIMLFIFTMFY